MPGIKTREAPKIPSVELLNSTHLFPGDYTFKIIAETDLALAQQVHLAIQIPSVTLPRISFRRSHGGKFTAVTLEVEVASADVVVDLYYRLLTIKGLRLLL